jgi:hypothetical protein
MTKVLNHTITGEPIVKLLNSDKLFWWAEDVEDFNNDDLGPHDPEDGWRWGTWEDQCNSPSFRFKVNKMKVGDVIYGFIAPDDEDETPHLKRFK